MENTEQKISPPEVNNNNNKVEHEIDALSREELIAENECRKAALKSDYDPIAGVGCCNERVPYPFQDDEGNTQTHYIPSTMCDELASASPLSPHEWQLLRFRHDFEYWCAMCVTILDKMSGKFINFVLNRPQRRVLQILESQRLAGQPLRLIMLKARQWGGSTLVQIYMIWIQLVLKNNWNSLICGHLQQTAAAIKSMYGRVLRRYPKDFSPNGEQPKFVTFEGSRNVKQLSSSESLIITASAQSEDAVRGYDVKMAHLSEVAFWPDTTLHSPDDLIRSIGGTVPLEPLTMIVLESTANGVGNFFHTEWQRAKSGHSDKAPVFVPWHEIEIYKLDVSDPEKLLEGLDDYEKVLWDDGCTLEQINWYHYKRKEYSSHVLMQAEFPSTDVEAFLTTSRNVFDPLLLESLRDTCTHPCERGDIVANGTKTVAAAKFVKGFGSNAMQVWKMPEPTIRRYRYLVAVDVGGSRADADWSVIAVFDTHNDAGKGQDSRPEIVAQRRGHIDKDLMAWKAAQIARFYNNALLVFESNSIESDRLVGDTLLNAIGMRYPHLYYRDNDKSKPGFHTNFKSKNEAISNLTAYIRDKAYIERDNQAVNEMIDYEIMSNGRSYGARKGCHDDILMTRAIGLQVIEQNKLHGAGSKAGNANEFINQNRPTAKRLHL
ncbi:MAG: hypothetical protein IKW83_11005 [Muribaculaceae bacterium]|nr:hypothetical protein [Muribaculaceae bacterium]